MGYPDTPQRPHIQTGHRSQSWSSKSRTQLTDITASVESRLHSMRLFPVIYLLLHVYGHTHRGVKKGAVVVKTRVATRDPECIFKELNISASGVMMFRDPSQLSVGSYFDNAGVYHQLHTENAPKGAGFCATLIPASDGMINDCLFVYDYAGAEEAPLLFIGPTVSFVNTGGMQFRVGGATRSDSNDNELAGTNIDIFVVSYDFVNNGWIEFIGENSHTALVSILSPPDHGLPIKFSNFGAILLRRTRMLILPQILGSGCIILGSTSMLILRDPNLVARNQVIYMKSSISVLKIEINPKDHNFRLWVRGFSAGALISFSETMRLGNVTNYWFSFYSSQSPHKSCIRLLHFELEDLSFDGKTLTTLRRMPRRQPISCIYSNRPLLDRVEVERKKLGVT